MDVHRSLIRVFRAGRLSCSLSFATIKQCCNEYLLMPFCAHAEVSVGDSQSDSALSKAQFFCSFEKILPFPYQEDQIPLSSPETCEKVRLAAESPPCLGLQMALPQRHGVLGTSPCFLTAEIEEYLFKTICFSCFYLYQVQRHGGRSSYSVLPSRYLLFELFSHLYNQLIQWKICLESIFFPVK